jgi:thioredoxin 1
MKNLIEIKDDNTNIINNEELLLMCFKSTWCAPCKILSPIINELSPENLGVTFNLIDVDENPNLCAKFGIRNIPTVLFLKNGEVVDKFVGAKSKEFIQEKIDTLK